MFDTDYPTTINKIAVTPFANKGVEIGKHGDGKYTVSRIDNTKTSLVELKVLIEARVVISGESYIVPVGARILVRASDYSAPWGTEVVEYEGTKMIFYPAERVEIFKGIET